MLKKKRLQHSSLSKHGKQQKSLPLSRLQKLVELERELVCFLGPRNIEIDNEGDLFARLEELYLKYLQNQPLGLEVLDKVIRLVGDADAPAKIRMMYFMAHETYVDGEDPTHLLQEGFNYSLRLKNKISMGYKCGLVLAQLSMCPRTVDNILSSLIVSLEEQIGFNPAGVRHLSRTISRNGSEQLKSVYIGSRLSRASKSKVVDCNRLQRIDLGKCLYEAYMIGYLRLQSEAKRRYYRDCQDELEKRLIRENPGINIKQKLISIDQGDTMIKQFQKTLIPLPKSVLNLKKSTFNKTDPTRWVAQEPLSHSASKYAHTYADFNQSKVAQSSHVSPERSSPKQKRLTDSQHRNRFKIQLKYNPNKKRANTSKSSSRHNKPQMATIDFQRESIRDSDGFKENQQQKSLVLKFDRLQHKKMECKEVKKRKLKPETLWADRQNQQTLEKAFDLSYVPETKEEQTNPCMGIQTEEQPAVLLETIPKAVDSNAFLDSLGIIGDIGENVKLPVVNEFVLDSIEPVAKSEQVEEKILSQRSQIEQIEDKIAEYLPQTEQRQLQIPTDSCALKDSLKRNARNQLRLSQSNSQSMIGSRRSLLHKESFTQNLMMSQHFRQELSDSNGQAEKISYKIIINNFEDECRLKDMSIKEETIKKMHFPLKKTLDNVTTSRYMCLITQCVDAYLTGVNLSIIDSASNKVGKVTNSSQSIPDAPPMPMKRVDTKKTNTLKSSKPNIQLPFDQTFDYLKSSSIIEEEVVPIEVDAYINSMFQDVGIQIVSSYTSLKSNLEKKHANNRERKDCQSKTQELAIPNFSGSWRISISDRLTEEPQVASKIATITECANSSLDDSDLSSEIPSSESEQFTQDTPYSPISKMGGRRNSNFTCSKFAGSKIELGDRESTGFWKSHMNIIEQLVKCIQGSDEKLKEPIIEEKTSRESNRSKILSERSAKTTKNITIPRESNIHSSQSIKKNTQLGCQERVIKFQHWLSPQLSLTEEEIICRIKYSESQQISEKRQNTPQALKKAVYNHEELSVDLLKFLQKFPKNETSWERIVQQFQKIELVPEKLKILSVQVSSSGLQTPVKLIFEFSKASNQLQGRCIPSSYRLFPISIYLNDSLESILPKLTPANIIVKQKDIIVSDLWTVIGKRNIKLRDKYENTTIHCVFQVFQCYLLSQEAFFYEVNGLNGEKMAFGNVSECLRNKVINNIDMIIGFAIKLNNKTFTFCPENINQLIKLL